MKPKVIFRADAGKDIGLGHFTRCLALAEAIHLKFNCFFATVNPSETQKTAVKNVCKGLISLPDNKSHFTEFLNMLDGSEIVVLDNYFFDPDYQKKIKDKGCKLVCIDDLADKHFYADAIINHTPGAEHFKYDKEKYTKVYAGIHFAMLRDEIHKAHKKLTAPQELKRGVVCFGGADIDNHTLKTILYLKETLPDLVKLEVVIGALYKHKNILYRTTGKMPDVVVSQNLSAKKLAYWIKQYDFSVVPASTLSIECAMIHTPLFLVQTADNQSRNYKFMIKYGCAMPLDKIKNYTFDRGQAMMQTQAALFQTNIQENLLRVFEEIL